MKRLVVLLGIVMLSCSLLFAHPGRTDKYGGHKGPGGYHYHNGTGSSSSSSSSNSSVQNSTRDYTMYDKSQVLINSKTAVDEAINMSAADLESYKGYSSYSMDIPGSDLGFYGQKKLFRTDSILLNLLTSLEDEYRNKKSNGEFLAYLDNRREWIASQYVNSLAESKMNNWINSYQAKIK